MLNNQSDKFEQSKSSPFDKISTADFAPAETNFFINNSNSVPISFIKQEQGRRLNDYDFNILKEDAYKDIKDDLFKLEYKISKLEKEMEMLESQIQAARDINDYDLVSELTLRKQVLSEDLEGLIAIYNDKSISARISDGIASLFGEKIKNKFNVMKSNLTFFTELMLSKMPKQFSSLVELKKSLSKLENINRSVDELMTFNAPYGENADKYEQLSKYIIKANSIQAQITQNMK